MKYCSSDGRTSRSGAGCAAQLLVAIGVILATVQPSDAQPALRQPTSPLNRVHAELRCQQCHVTEENMPANLCLSCHKEIGQRAAQGRGLHGLPKVRSKQCWECHAEHRGPDGDIRGWGSVGGQASFNHAQLSFPLSGKHAERACAECHSSVTPAGKPTFLDKAQSCVPCHVKDEPHQGTLGPDCLRCHVGETWTATRFKHDQHSRFALRGKHQAAAEKQRCIGCHPKSPKLFKPLAMQCGDGACHAKNDAHKGLLGRDCASCHTETRDWRQSTFEHNDPRAADRFRLVGGHAKLDCAGCHKREDGTQPRIFRGLLRACEGCHAKNDSHRGDFGSRCGSCHAPTGWKQVRAEHDTTPQRFGGAHDRVPCATCHAGPRKLRGTASLCITCHQRDDIHHNALGPTCGDCHTQQTFAGARFRHDTVGCTLRGIHRALPCVDCHKGGNYAGLVPFCVGCHRDDAMRAAGAGVLPELHVVQTACTPCHNTITFRGALTRQSPPESVCQ